MIRKGAIGSCLVFAAMALILWPVSLWGPILLAINLTQHSFVFIFIDDGSFRGGRIEAPEPLAMRFHVSHFNAERWGGGVITSKCLYVSPKQFAGTGVWPPDLSDSLPRRKYDDKFAFSYKEPIKSYSVGIPPLSAHSVLMPIWVPLLFGIYPAIAFIRGPFRRYRRRKKGLCIKCAYNLTGNVSGVCPECGERI